MSWRVVNSETDLANTARVLDTIASLEGEGIFAAGARDLFLKEVGMGLSHVFLQLVPAGELAGQLKKEGYDEIIENIVTTDIRERFDSDSLTKHYPYHFFTPTGTTANFPPEKIGVAIEAWHMASPSGAEEWFTANANTLPPSQQDEIRIGFVKNFWENQKVADTRRWLDQIPDPVLREEVLNALPKRGRLTSDALKER